MKIANIFLAIVAGTDICHKRRFFIGRTFYTTTFGIPLCMVIFLSGNLYSNYFFVKKGLNRRSKFDNQKYIR